MDLSRIADPEKRRRTEKALQILADAVYEGFWGTLTFEFKAGLPVCAREEKTRDLTARE